MKRQKSSGNNQFTHPWGKEELEKLISLFPVMFEEEAHLLFPGRTAKAVREKGKALGMIRGTRKVFFPKQYTSQADGGYVSGLIDGEGWFMSTVRKQKNSLSPTNYNPKFGINLRLDDRPILEWIKKYFGSGHINTTARNGKNPNANPSCVFHVASLYEIMSTVIPHFDAFPLRAKKANDYAIWKQMIMLQSTMYHKKPLTNEYLVQMRNFYEQLKIARVYSGPSRSSLNNSSIASL